MRRILLIILALFIPALAWAQTCGNGYSTSLYIDVRLQPDVALSGNVTYPFPVTFNGAATDSISFPALKQTGSGGLVTHTAANSAGDTGPADVVACDAPSGGNALKYQAIGYNGTTGYAYLRVQTVISSATGKGGFWLFVGNNSVTTTQQDLSLWSDAGAVAAWLLPDGTTLTYKDYSGNANNGTASGTVTAVAGRYAGGANVTGGSYIRVTSSSTFKPTTALTIETWAKPTTVGNYNKMVALSYRSDGSWSSPYCAYCLTTWSGGSTISANVAVAGTLYNLTTAASIPVGSLSHVAETYDGTTLKAYINGVQDANTISISGTIDYGTSGDLALGTRSPYTTGENWDGWLDETIIYGVAKNADWFKVGAKAFATALDSRTPSGLTSGSYCIPYTIDYTEVPNTDRTNYQLTVHGYYKWMATIPNGGLGANASGYDLRWYSDSSCTSLLNFQRVYWSATTGQSEWKVLVPSVSHTAPGTTIYFAIGNAANNTDAQSISGTWPSSWINVMLWGDPASLSTTSSGQDQTAHSIGAFTTAGSPAASIGPMGTVLYLPPGNTSYVNFVPGSPFKLSTFGYPVDTAVSSMSIYFKGTLSTSAQAIGNAITIFGGHGCSLHPGGCNNPATDGAREFWYQAPNFGNSCGFSTGDSNDSAACSNKLYDLQWHRITYIYTPTGAQMGDATVLNLIDGAVVSVSHSSPTTVLHTSDGTSLNSSEVNWGRAPAHGAGAFTGYLGPAIIYSGVWTADDDATYYNNETAPYLFGAWGTAAPATTTAVKHKIVRH